MRILLIGLVAAVMAVSCASARGLAQVVYFRQEMRQLKARQKQERHALKQQEKYRRQSLKEQKVPKAVRLQIKHEMARDARALREKQRNEREQIKDMQRLSKASASFQ